MAKKRRKKSRQKRIKSRIQRDINTITKSPWRLLYSKSKKKPLGDDRRRFKPKHDDHPRLRDGRRVSYQLSDPLGINKLKGRLKYTTAAKLGFRDPLKTLICVRRAARRLTLFRYRKIGSGIAVRKRRIRNKYSNIKCRRS